MNSMNIMMVSENETNKHLILFIIICSYILVAVILINIIYLQVFDKQKSLYLKFEVMSNT